MAEEGFQVSGVLCSAEDTRRLYPPDMETLAQPLQGTMPANFQHNMTPHLRAGLMVTERNWLEVYPYTNWGSAQQLPHVQRGQTFMPTSLLLKDVRNHCFGVRSQGCLSKAQQQRCSPVQV